MSKQQVLTPIYDSYGPPWDGEPIVVKLDDLPDFLDRHGVRIGANLWENGELLVQFVRLDNGTH